MGACPQLRRPALFLRKSNSTQLADLFVELVLLCVRLLTHLLPAIAEYVGQSGQSLFLPASDLGRVDTEHLSDLGSRPMGFDGLDGHSGFQAGWMILACFGH
jgi:hypothetical protein